ncbi:MAG: phosphoribosyltransferase [Pyrinomonadaceae bacterium]
MLTRYVNRTEAGRELATKLTSFAGRDDVVVLALPRGGVPVAFEVARSLGAPLDVFVVRKLGVPGHEELAFGAIASGGVRVFADDTIRALRLTQPMIESVIRAEEKELARRERLYRGERPRLELRGKTVIIVDDGLATGASMLAAVRVVRTYQPAQIVVAVPVAARETCAKLHDEADLVCVCAITPEPFYGVGMWYYDFSPTSDEEVQALLAEARARETNVGSGA